jgi:uncharacterized protein YjdB
LFLFTLGLVACQNPPTVTIGTDLSDGLTMTEGDTLDLDDYTITTDDEDGVEYRSSDTTVFTVDDDGVITAIGEGVADLRITAAGDDDIFVNVPITVRKRITIDTDTTELNLIQEDVVTIDVTSNDGLTFASSNPDIFVVDTDGELTAKEVGTATLTITSTYDDTFVEIVVHVALKVELSLVHDDYFLIVGGTQDIQLTTNDDVTYQSSQSSVVTIDDSGTMTAEGFGTATIVVTSVSDPSIQVSASVTVYKETEGLSITGSPLMVVGMSTPFGISPSPAGAYDGVIWTSLNEDIADVDADGNVTALAVGNARIQATSTFDDTIHATFDIEIIHVLAVDATATTGSTFDYNGVALAYGTHLFATIGEALAAATEGTLIHIAEGTYDEAVSIAIDDLTIEGGSGALIEGVWTIAADDLLIRNLTFVGAARITNSTPISSFSFLANHVDSIDATCTSRIWACWAKKEPST